ERDGYVLPWASGECVTARHGGASRGPLSHPVRCPLKSTSVPLRLLSIAVDAGDQLPRCLAGLGLRCARRFRRPGGRASAPEAAPCSIPWPVRRQPAVDCAA